MLNGTYPIGLFWELNKILYVKHLEQWLAHSRGSIWRAGAPCVLIDVLSRLVPGPRDAVVTQTGEVPILTSLHLRGRSKGVMRVSYRVVGTWREGSTNLRKRDLNWDWLGVGGRAEEQQEWGPRSMKEPKVGHECGAWRAEQVASRKQNSCTFCFVLVFLANENKFETQKVSIWGGGSKEPPALQMRARPSTCAVGSWLPRLGWPHVERSVLNGPSGSTCWELGIPLTFQLLF